MGPCLFVEFQQIHFDLFVRYGVAVLVIRARQFDRGVRAGRFEEARLLLAERRQRRRLDDGGRADVDGADPRVRRGGADLRAPFRLRPYEHRFD